MTGQRKRLLERMEHRHRQGGRTRTDEAQRIGLDHLGIAIGARQDRLVHGRHRRVPGGLRLLHPAKEFQRVETRCATDRRTGMQAGEDRRDQTVDVEQRHDVEAAVCRCELQRAGDVAGRGQKVGVGRAARSWAARWCRRYAAPAPCRQSARHPDVLAEQPRRLKWQRRQLRGRRAASAPESPAGGRLRWRARRCPPPPATPWPSGRPCRNGTHPRDRRGSGGPRSRRRLRRRRPRPCPDRWAARWPACRCGQSPRDRSADRVSSQTEAKSP